MRFTGSEIAERRLPTGKDMMKHAVAKAADETLPLLEQGTGKAARMLVNRLKGDEYSGLDAEQVALILAEKLIGGDSQFQTLAVPETRGGSRQNFRNDYSGAARRAKRTGRRSGPVTSAGRSAKHS